MQTESSTGPRGISGLCRRLFRTLTVIAALGLAGCFDMKQDIWIHEDGSGLIVMDVGIYKQMDEMMNSLAEGLGAEDSQRRDLEAEARSLEDYEFIKALPISSTSAANPGRWMETAWVDLPPTLAQSSAAMRF